MKDRFDDIRAERDEPLRTKATKPHEGLWKQIALGIIAAYSVIVITSTIGWTLVALFATRTISFSFQ